MYKQTKKYCKFKIKLKKNIKNDLFKYFIELNKIGKERAAKCIG